MSLASAKSLLFSRHSSRNYSPLPQHNTPHSTERPSQDSSSNSKPTRTLPPPPNEKQTPLNPPPPTPKTTTRHLANITLGLSDGLTVPFALTAGLSALGDTHLVLKAGLAELAAGAISMGLGGYLGARSEAASYRAALARARVLVDEEPERAGEMVREVLGVFGLGREVGEGEGEQEQRQGRERLVAFIVRFCWGLDGEEGSDGLAWRSGGSVAVGYLVGGLVPLAPYLVFGDMRTAFGVSVVVMGVALFAFGVGKAWVLEGKRGVGGLWEGVLMVVLGGLAAGAAVVCVSVLGEGV